MGKSYVLERVGHALVEKYPEIIPLSLETVLERASTNHNGVLQTSVMSLKPSEHCAIAEVIKGHFKVRTREREATMHPKEWIFFYDGDKIRLGDYGTYKLKENI